MTDTSGTGEGDRRRRRTVGARLRDLLTGDRKPSAHAVGINSPLDVLGEWDMVAATAGFFERPRVDSAHLTFRSSNAREVDFSIELQRRGRDLRVAAMVPTTPDSQGLYTWKGRGAMFIVARSKWGLACSEDRTVAAIHHPATMSSDAGAVVILRSDIDSSTARRRVESALSDLRLSRSQFIDLSWRI